MTMKLVLALAVLAFVLAGCVIGRQPVTIRFPSGDTTTVVHTTAVVQRRTFLPSISTGAWSEFYSSWSQPPPCKVGAGVPYPFDMDYGALAGRGICSVMDWGYFDQPMRVASIWNLKYYPTQWGCRPGSVNVPRLQEFARHWPGATWLMFNEPDLVVQANCTPLEGVVAYEKATKAILSVDPSASFACCGEAFGKHAWTDKFLALYQPTTGHAPRIDRMQIHIYGDWTEINPWDHEKWYDRFNWKRSLRDQYLAWRAWQVGQPALKNLPVIVSETGLLTGAWWDGNEAYNCDAWSEADRMAKCIIPGWTEWLRGRPEIESFMWFSTYLGIEFLPSQLCTDKPCRQITSVGAAYSKAAR